jgi:hypothetical protein
MSLIIPKKEILYAPMLGTLGGGSARGFGRGAGGAIIINQTFNATNSSGRTGTIQSVTVLGTYRIEVVGAQPPAQTHSTPYYDGGRAARLVGDFTFDQETELRILVGQKPTQSQFNGGGGGSFVAVNPDIPVIVAGGGGSMRCGDCAGRFGSNEGDFGNLDATFPSSLGQSYGNSNNTNSGGGNGNAGSNDVDSQGSPGAGFYQNGPSESNVTAALSFTNGGTGGNYASSGNQMGGFGGGGAGGWGGSGGGGGYNGGAAGSNCVSNDAGGGGSFITSAYSASFVASNLYTTGAGSSGYNGFVRIDSI